VLKFGKGIIKIPNKTHWFLVALSVEVNHFCREMMYNNAIADLMILHQQHRHWALGIVIPKSEAGLKIGL